MPFIGKQPQTGAYSKLDAITTSATATYNLTLDGSAYYPQSANHLMVSLNGVIQAPQDSFTISGSQITFASALTSSDNIDFIMALGDTLDIGVPSDGSVVTGKLANSAVTAAKIGSGAVEGAAVTQLGGRRNAIINGNFQVSQRGDYSSATTVTTNYGYLVDRWVVYGTSVTPDFTHTNNSVKLEATAASAAHRLFHRTNLEAQDILPDTTYTLSFYVTTNSSSFGVHINDNSGTIDTSVISVSSGVRTKVTVTFDTPSTIDTILEIAIGIFASGRNNTSISIGDYVTLEQVQLEVGSVATPFEYRPYGEELSLCKRYYYQIGSSTTALTRFGIIGETSAANVAQYNLLFPTPLRTGPSLVLNDNGGTTYVYTANTSYAATAVVLANTVYNENGDAVAARVNINSSGLPTGNACQAYNSTVGSTLAFDSEL